MQPADYIAIVFGTITVVGGILGWILHKLDKVQTVLEVKNETIAAHEKTIEIQDRNIILLEATAKATNNLIGTLKVVVGGEAP